MPILTSMKQFQHLFIVALALVLLAGCSTTQKRTYDISVRNATEGPITLWLTKDGPPYDAGWLAPEHIAASAPAHEERISGVVVPPGKTAYTGPLTGEFEPNTTAILRIYGNKYPSFSDLLAVPPRSPERIDHPLDPGKSMLVVTKRAGKLQVADDPTPTPESK